MGDDKVLLHHAEELGQARALTSEEVTAWLKLAAIMGVWGAAVGLLAFNGVWLWKGHDLSLWTLALGAAGGWVVVSGVILAKGIGQLIYGLRSWRQAQTFAPSSTQPEGEPPHPPILVRPYKGEPYTIGQPERPLLPGRSQALEITPTVVAEVLKASLEQYGGEWSRRKLMRLRVAGNKVTRGMYEELTSWLSRAGVLLQTRQGGFMLPPDVSEFEDLAAYFPNLPGLGNPTGNWEGREGNWEGRERGGPVAPPLCGEVGSLAERRRQKFVELGCDVVAYLEWRQNHDR